MSHFRPKTRKSTKPLNETKSAFKRVVPLSKLGENYKLLRKMKAQKPARWMIDDVFQTFTDPDGNFLEQFQSVGFDARLFELYLFAFLTRSGYEVDRTSPNPDFIATRDGISVAIEATIASRATSGPFATREKKLGDLLPDELREYQRSELPIRLGSPLFSKLSKKYWELENCKNRPFVIAIQPFYDDEALSLSDAGLSMYLYGSEHSAHWNTDGELQISASRITEHRAAGKKIPSGFFFQPDAEHISAIAFTNSGTLTKFQRMGFQYGISNNDLYLTRSGFCFNPEPTAMDPSFFSYDLEHPPEVESWSQGMIVYHNPNAKYPLPMQFFHDLVQGYIEDGKFITSAPVWHPLVSKTMVFNFGKQKRDLRKIAIGHPLITINAISRSQFESLCQFAIDEGNPILSQMGWFADNTLSFAGVLVFDKTDENWGFLVLARDDALKFRAIQTKTEFRLRDDARTQLHAAILGFLNAPKRIFRQD